MRSDVPAGWRQARFRDIAHVNHESLGSRTRADTTIRYLDIASVNGPGRIREPSCIVFADAPSRARRVVRDGDTLVSCVRPYLRSFAYVPRAGPRLVASTGFAVLSPKRGTDPQFLFQTVLRDEFTSFLVQRMTGSNYPAVNATDVKEAPVLLPPLPEQKKIAAILSSVDGATRATEAVIEQTRRLKEGLLQELLTRGIGPDGRPHTDVKMTEIGEIPEVWRVTTVGDVSCASAFGPRFSSDAYDEAGNFALLRTTDIDSDWVINYDSMPIAALPSSEFDSHVLLDGDLLITRSGTCGVTVLFDDSLSNLPVIPGAFLIRFRLNRSLVRPRFVLAAFKSHSVQRALRAVMAGGAQKNLSGTTVRTVRLPLPGLEEQGRIADAVAAIEDQIAGLAATVEQHRAVKSGLLQDLLTGKVRVTP